LSGPAGSWPGGAGRGIVGFCEEAVPTAAPSMVPAVANPTRKLRRVFTETS
jgi:hypothetical protein